MNERELTALFRKLGARDPAAWARSQINENIPQLARFLFLRRAWKLVVNDNDSSRVSKMRELNSNKPGGGIGPAITRLLAAGGHESDLTKIVRVMQWQLLSGLCQLLDDPGDIESEAGDIAWRLFQVDEGDRPIAIMGGLADRSWRQTPLGARCGQHRLQDARGAILSRLDPIVSLISRQYGFTCGTIQSLRCSAERWKHRSAPPKTWYIRDGVLDASLDRIAITTNR